MIRTQDISRDEGALMMETELCDNCNIAVPSVHFVMHVEFCKRNMQMCQDCGIPVPASQKEEHHEAFHGQVDCSECGMAIAKSEETRHFARHCPQTPTGCRFCLVELPRRNIREHEAICDLKSERCERCTEHILVKDLVRHREVCIGDSELVVLPCEFCCASMSPNKLMAHQKDCAQQRGIEVPGGRTVRPLPDINRSEDAFGSTRVVYRGEASSGETHGEQLSAEGGRACRATDVYTRCEKNSRVSNVVALPCEICGDLCPSDKLIKHQKECIENQDRKSRDRERQRQNSAPQNPAVVGEGHSRTRVTYVSSRAEREKSLSSLEFEDNTDSDLDINARFPRSIDTNVFSNETDPLFTSTAFSHRINCHFGRLRNFK